MRPVESKSALTLVEPLTHRESQILALLAAGYSRAEIAAHLTLALSSVKTHLHHLYAKLGVNTKRQALQRAQALGLLAPRPTPPTQNEPPGLTARHNLSLPATQFFGREAELAQVRERLDEHRLVTLTGSGGVGKTRLAQRAAEELLPDFTDGVWLVELAPLSDPALVVQQTAASLRLRDDPGQPIFETLTVFLRDRQILLVLDNCEHLLEACARLADALLRACPRLRLLASSREPLGVPGEAVFRIPSLPFPAPDQALSPDELQAYPSVRLFLDRARLVTPDYAVAAHNASALARICQRLDGIPLAIEMAAARVNVLNAEQLAGRLDNVFRLLTGGSRTALPRQQTLRATIDWSYQLLGEAERRLLQRLAVFAGGCTLEAVEAVGADARADETGEATEDSQVLDALTSLVAKSLVNAERRPGDEPRYYLLETTRQYAQEKLRESGDDQWLHTRHRDYYAQFVETNVPKLDSAEKPVWEQRLKAERENIRQALEWSFTDARQPELGPRLMFALRGVPWVSHQEGVDWFLRAAAWCEGRAGIAPALYADLLGQASLAVSMNDPRAALGLARRCVEVSREAAAGDPEALLSPLLILALIHLEALAEPEQAAPVYAEVEAILQGLEQAQSTPEQYQGMRAHLAHCQAKLAVAQKHYQAAKQIANESLRLYQAEGDRWGAINPRLTLGEACLKLGEYEQARDHLLAALDLIEASEDWHKAHALVWLAMVDVEQGQVERALDYCWAAVQAAEIMPDRNMTASGLGNLARVWARLGRPQRAARLAGAAQALYARQHRKPWEDSSLDTLFPNWRAGPDQAAISEAYAAGQALSVEQAVALAMEEPDPKGL